MIIGNVLPVLIPKQVPPRVNYYSYIGIWLSKAKETFHTVFVYLISITGKP